MPNLLQLNLACNWGSTGRIAEDIGLYVEDRGWTSYIAYGTYYNPSKLNEIKVGSKQDYLFHHLKSRLFDAEGLGSKEATKIFIKQIEKISPDIIHLHNIHGSWVNYPILFDFLATSGIPVVWTLHDCWCFTGHCACFEHNGCFKWKDGCQKCNFKGEYPPSSWLSRSTRNFKLKKSLFTSLGDRLTLVAVSNWLKDYIEQSFFRDTKICVIHNGIDLTTFQPCARKSEHLLVLGVANAWAQRKGLDDFIKLRKILPSDVEIILVGLTEKQISSLPSGIIGNTRTNSVQELAEYYSRATVFVNMTYSDNYPTVNLEAIACGTPIITYRTGGSPEAVDESTGIVVAQGDLDAIENSIKKIISNPGIFTQEACTERARAFFDKRLAYSSYLDLYRKLLGK